MNLQHSQYLSALGVTQYRRRSLQVAPAKLDDDVLGADAERALSKEAIDYLAKDSSAITSTQEIKSIENPIGTAATKAESFELLIWKTPKILVLDFSEADQTDVSVRHQLANNILRAIWPEDFIGAEVHQHLWPIVGINASAEAASSWLGSMISGHTQQKEKTPIWLMGEKGIELLFNDTGTDKSGTVVDHKTLGVELYITQSLSEMLTSTVAKANTWQLLKTLRN